MCWIRFDLCTAEPHVAPSDAGGRISKMSNGTEVSALARTHPTQFGGESHVGNRRGKGTRPENRRFDPLLQELGKLTTNREEAGAQDSVTGRLDS